MLVLALPAKSFQLYFNFIQSAAPPPLLPPRVIAYFRTNGGGWKEKGTCIVIINYSRGTETDKERERSRATFNFSTTTAIVPFRAESRQIYDVSLYTAGKPELSHGD